jgi:hypothetical protein
MSIQIVLVNWCLAYHKRRKRRRVLKEIAEREAELFPDMVQTIEFTPNIQESVHPSVPVPWYIHEMYAVQGRQWVGKSIVLKDGKAVPSEGERHG